MTLPLPGNEALGSSEWPERAGWSLEKLPPASVAGMVEEPTGAVIELRGPGVFQPEAADRVTPARQFRDTG